MILRRMAGYRGQEKAGRSRWGVGLLVCLLVAAPVGLAHHASSHCHAADEGADCDFCILHSQFAAPVQACLDTESAAASILTPADPSAPTGPGAPFCHPVRGPPPTSV